MKQDSVDRLITLYFEGHADLEDTARRLWDELRPQMPGLVFGFGDLPANQRRRGEELLARLQVYMQRDMRRRMDDARRGGGKIGQIRGTEDSPPSTA